MRARLPRPALFTAAFNKSYADMCKAHPFFGAKSGMTSRQWWFEVVKKTYSLTENLNAIEPAEMEGLLPTVFEMLYQEVFSTKVGWSLKEDALYTLNKLRDWRDLGAGPKIGVISDFDDRLPTILAELGVANYFDFIITSQQAKADKTQKQIFDLALGKAGLTSAETAYHVGVLSQDVEGAAAAGWRPLRFSEWFDESFPDWTVVDSEEDAAKGAERSAKHMSWGRRDTATGVEWIELWGLDDILTIFGFPEDPNKPIRTTYVRNVLSDE